MMIRITYFLSFLSIVFSSCLPLYHMESARTLGKGSSAVEGTLGIYKFSDQNNQNILKGIPTGDIRYRHGVSDKLEIAGGFNLIGFLLLDTKYQLIGTKTSHFALSFGVSADSYVIPVTGNSIPFNLKVTLPVYMSYHFSEKGYVYFNPEYAHQFGERGDIDSAHFFGTTTGLGFKRKNFEFGFGGGVFFNTNSVDYISYFGLNLRYLFYK